MASFLIAARKTIGNGGLTRLLGYQLDYLNHISATDIALLTSISDGDLPPSPIEGFLSENQ